MGIEEQLTTRLKEAMRAKRADEVQVLRMVKTQASRARSAPGFSRETDDDFWIEVVSSYVRQQRKALEEFRKAGERGADQVRALEFEISYLGRFLPAQLDEAAVRDLVRAAIEEIGATGPKMAGRIVGAVVKAHRDRVDPAMVKRVATEELG